MLRDTEDPNSVLRYHSLLRDLYGTRRLSGRGVPQPDCADRSSYSDAVCRCTAATTRALPQRRGFGTHGRANRSISTSRRRVYDPPATRCDLRHVLKLDRNGIGQPQLHALPLTKGLLQRLRAHDHQRSGRRAIDADRRLPIRRRCRCDRAIHPGRRRLFRFRVMAIPRTDGQTAHDRSDGTALPELTDLAGATIPRQRPARSAARAWGTTRLATSGTAAAQRGAVLSDWRRHRPSASNGRSLPTADTSSIH